MVSEWRLRSCVVGNGRDQFFLNRCTRQSPAESDDTRGCICTIFVVDLLMMGGMRSKHIEDFNKYIICKSIRILCIKLEINQGRDGVWGLSLWILLVPMNFQNFWWWLTTPLQNFVPVILWTLKFTRTIFNISVHTFLKTYIFFSDTNLLLLWDT
jgi:hypothetical protein